MNLSPVDALLFKKYDLKLSIYTSAIKIFCNSFSKYLKAIHIARTSVYSDAKAIATVDNRKTPLLFIKKLSNQTSKA